jgi:ABC-type nitrate/sulfonate/bicarbonate transport system substrate-binding protein
VLQLGSNPQAATAMVTGNIDAAAVSGIMVPTAERAGALTLADGRAMNLPAVSGALAATRSRIDRDRAETLRFMKAYVEAIHYFKTQRDATIPIMQQYMSGLAWDETAYLWEEAAGDFQPLPYPSDEAVQAAIERDLELPPGEFKPSDFYDVSFLREIEASGLVKDLYK